MVVYSFYGGKGDNMWRRQYLVSGTRVIRVCSPRGCLSVIRQRISRDQAAAEMRQLRSVCEYNSEKGAN